MTVFFFLFILRAGDCYRSAFHEEPVGSSSLLSASEAHTPAGAGGIDPATQENLFSMCREASPGADEVCDVCAERTYMSKPNEVRFAKSAP